MQIAGKALRTANAVRQLLNVEFKKVVIGATAAAVNWDGNLIHITNVAQGDANSARDGDSLKVKRIVGRLWVDSNSAANAVVRVMLLRSIRGSGQTIANIFAEGYPGTALAPLSPKFYENRKQYKILWDRTVTLTDVDNQLKFLRFNVGKLDHQTDYDTGTTNATANAYYLVYMSNIDDVAANVPVINYIVTAYFLDN